MITLVLVLLTQADIPTGPPSIQPTHIQPQPPSVPQQPQSKPDGVPDWHLDVPIMPIWVPAPKVEKLVAATMEVTVAARAALFVDGDATTSTGTVRKFITPPLIVGHTYDYGLRAEWSDAGGHHVVSRSLAVSPGETSQIDMSHD